MTFSPQTVYSRATWWQSSTDREVQSWKALCFCDLEWNTHFFDLPLPLGGGDVVSTVICFVHTRAADADVVSATEELQVSLVDGTQRQRRSAARAAQSVPVKGERSSQSAEIQQTPPINININRAFKCTGEVVCGRMVAGHRACCR